jgi:hypothetical protein
MPERAALRTKWLRLEPTGPEHADAIWAAVEASLFELRPWLYWAKDYELEHARAFAERCLKQWGTTEWTFQSIGTVNLSGLSVWTPISLFWQVLSSATGWGRTRRAVAI